MFRTHSSIAALLAGALLIPRPALAQDSAQQVQSQRITIAAHVAEASQRFGIPERWIYAVIRIESAGRTRAVSSAGAMGLMQLMPGTWARQRARFGLGGDPFDPRDNILAGTSYLREMYDRYGAQGFLAAYNAGPGRYEAWLDGRRSLPRETQNYVAMIAPHLQQPSLFAAAPMQMADTSSLPEIAGQSNAIIENETELANLPASPFVRPDHPSHDLFAPVSAVSDQ
ncbi:transglycosylase SLT domain-containing protein [Porphyrobacter algicida]|uniref:Transglycosylase SLT domain-containing protein n=1 Tax=Qipengyuania algicida TaxID=1836209 RepID=A0A845AMR1_9SPHN|nr:lytic transglycosylase domain-containing protein [Qipengyuania algicida]MXP30175.1 transglycosylase SLT domain-containing protein [Qipengyuania algicida]